MTTLELSVISLMNNLPTFKTKFDMSEAADYSQSAFSLSVRQTKFSIPSITIEEVSDSLKQLNPSTATGIDGLPAHFLKFPADMISNTVTVVLLSFQTSLINNSFHKSKHMLFLLSANVPSSLAITQTYNYFM
jgi:hypothetical protein